MHKHVDSVSLAKRSLPKWFGGHLARKYATVLIKRFALIGDNSFRTYASSTCHIRRNAGTYFLGSSSGKKIRRNSFSIVPQNAHLQGTIVQQSFLLSHAPKSHMCGRRDTGILVVPIYLQLCFGMPLFRSAQLSITSKIYIFFFSKAYLALRRTLIEPITS